jgi:DsbC/DsbD-like thiol-disulfide interchange protein
MAIKEIPFMKRFSLFSFTLAVILLAANLSETQAQTVNGSIGNGTAKRGRVARASIVIDIPDGLHVNSNRPSSQYSIATSVKVSGSGVKVGPVRYPRGHNRKFQFSEQPINVYEGRVNVYEGRVSFPFSVTVPANFKGNTVKVRALVRYQACTNEVCYPPKNKEVTLSARVR